MNRNLIYLSILLMILILTLSFITLTSFNYINAQVEPSKDPIQPIPPSNNTNTNQTTPLTS